LLLISMMSFFHAIASASCASVVTSPINRNPTSVASGAAPLTPSALFPFAAATPAHDVP
jgi:hypothetical protein